jgi:hypothetical protein
MIDEDDRPRGSTRDERAEYKTATMLALNALREMLGPNAGEAVTTKDKTTLSNYKAPNLTKCFIPIDVVRDIEAALGREPFTEALARHAGYKLVPLEGQKETGATLAQRIAEVADAEARLRLDFKRRAPDGIDHADRMALRLLLDDLKSDTADFERGLQ